MSYTKDAKQDDFLVDSLAYDFCDSYNERSLLSVVSKYEDAFFTTLAKASDIDFLAPESKAFFAMLSLLHKSGYKNFDKSLLSKAAKDLNCSDMCSDVFIDAILNLPSSASNLDNYMLKLLDDSTKYKLYKKLNGHITQIKQNAGLMDSKNSDDLINLVQSDILALSIKSEAISEPQHISDGLDDYISSIADNKIEVMGLSTGYPILDKVIDGLIPGTLMIVAARKKMGKSTLLTNIATNVAVNDGLPVLYLDTEMTFKEWRDRVLAIISGVKERTIKHGGFKKDNEIYTRIMNAAEYLKKSKLFHHYVPGYNVDKISALYKKYKFKEDIQLAVFDYVKEPESTSVEAGRKEYQILGDVTTRLKDLSGQLNIPFLAAVQVNRAGDVADSDRVARYADIVAFWGLRDKKIADEEGWDLDTVGHYGLSIRDTRRGGGTSDLGIGFKFRKTRLRILEVPKMDQVENFDFLDEPVKVDVGNVNSNGLVDEDGIL
ncbi:AAA family ATPase [bacterium]|nr:AAA family ATPase [bacterium]